MFLSRRELLATAASFTVPDILATALETARHSPGAPRPERKPWLRTTEAQLRAFRGAISTTRLKLPYGPRPDRDDNVLFAPTYAIYDASDRARMREAYRLRGYTHWPIGPVSRPQKLYHDQYPPAPFDSIAEPNRYADRLEELWDAGFVPVYFALPDTPDFMGRDDWDWDAVERILTPIYASPRWQEMVRVVVLGWEPDVALAVWERGARWMARVFPHALRYVHMVSDRTAPCRSADLADSGGTLATEGDAWRRVAPYLHGFLYQSGAMAHRGSVASGRAPVEQFRYDLWRLSRRLHDDAEGWPAISASSGRPLDIVAFEYASYWSYWNNVPEAEAREWGDVAMGKEGSVRDPVTREQIDLRGMLAGYGDGGTMAPARCRSGMQ